MVAPLEITATWQIPSHELSARYIRSSGPGGQNVNKLATKVELRFALAASAALSPEHKDRIRLAFPSACTSQGDLILRADGTRSQQENLEAARLRLRAIILQTRFAPKKRHATKPTRGSQRRRLETKKQRSTLKKLRSKVDS